MSTLNHERGPARTAVSDGRRRAHGTADRAGRRLGLRDRYFRRNRTAHTAYRTVVGVVGGLVLLLGILLIPLPGPGWLIVFAGLAILGSEFQWARRLLRYVRARVTAWSHWVGRQSLLVRAVVSVGCLALLAALAVGYLGLAGVPAWVPDPARSWLASWVPTIG